MPLLLPWAPVSLKGVSPCVPTLNCWYSLRLTPAALGAATCTTDTPLAAASAMGRWPRGAAGLVVMAAAAGVLAVAEVAGTDGGAMSDARGEAMEALGGCSALAVACVIKAAGTHKVSDRVHAS